MARFCTAGYLKTSRPEAKEIDIMRRIKTKETRNSVLFVLIINLSQFRSANLGRVRSFLWHTCRHGTRTHRDTQSNNRLHVFT